MQEQIAFYRNVMGFTIVYPSGLDDYSDENFVRFDTSGAYLVLTLRTPERERRR